MSTYYAEHMAKLPYGLDLYTESATPQCPIGTRVVLGDGRAYVYCRVGSAGNIAIGELCQVAAPEANHLNMSVLAAQAVGDQTITFTSGATAAAANLYAGGFAHINAPLTTDGGGQMFKIKSHAAWGSGGSGAILLYDKIRVALTTSSKLTLRQHPYDSIIKHPLTVSGAAVGVAIMPMTASYYSWIQTTGPCSCRITGTVVIGSGVIPDAAGTAGTLIPLAETSITPELGRVMAVNATATYALIWLAIPGVI